VIGEMFVSTFTQAGMASIGHMMPLMSKLGNIVPTAICRTKINANDNENEN
jgi:hypothetical protein